MLHFLLQNQDIRSLILFVMLQYVMIVLKGSVPMSFGGTEQPTAYGELVSIGGLSPDVNKKLCAAISNIVETKLNVPKSRFFLKFFDTKASNFSFNIIYEAVNSTHAFSHCILPLCLGPSKSRICTMSACFTPVLGHVNNTWSSFSLVFIP